VNDKNKVLAATLDVRLAANGVDLDSVVPLEVMLSSRRRYYGRDRRGLSSSEEEEEGASVVPGGQLAVSMEVMGHYSPPPDIDFDYVVRDSINRDTDSIRRGLSEYNVHCREQTSKVLEQGLVRDDFDSVLSASGARPNGYYDGLPADTGGGAGGGSFSTACSSSILVPEYFETNLREIEARGVSEVRFVASTSSAAATSSGLEAWAQGPVAAITGLIVLLAGVLLFRRSLGPRPAAGGGEGGSRRQVPHEGGRRQGREEQAVPLRGGGRRRRVRRLGVLLRRRRRRRTEEDGEGGQGQSQEQEGGDLLLGHFAPRDLLRGFRPRVPEVEVRQGRRGGIFGTVVERGKGQVDEGREGQVVP
jgi:hypothetical protein